MTEKKSEGSSSGSGGYEKIHYMGSAIIGGPHHPQIAPPKKKRLTEAPLGPGAANIRSLFDAGESVVGAGLGLIFTPGRSAQKIKSNLEKRYERAKKETKEGILEPVFYAYEHQRPGVYEEIERKDEPDKYYMEDEGIYDENIERRKKYEDYMRKEFLQSKPYKRGEGPLLNKEKFGKERVEIRSIKPTPRPRYVPEKRSGSFMSNLTTDIKIGLSGTLYDRSRKESPVSPSLKKPSFGFIENFDTSPGVFSDSRGPIKGKGNMGKVKPRYVPESNKNNTLSIGNISSVLKSDIKTTASKTLYDRSSKEKPVSPKIKKPSFGDTIDLDISPGFFSSGSGKMSSSSGKKAKKKVKKGRK
jgi:hypothetical protein